MVTDPLFSHEENLCTFYFMYLFSVSCVDAVVDVGRVGVVIQSIRSRF